MWYMQYRQECNNVVMQTIFNWHCWIHHQGACRATNGDYRVEKNFPWRRISQSPTTSYILKPYAAVDNIATVNFEIRSFKKIRSDGRQLCAAATMEQGALMWFGLFRGDTQRPFRRRSQRVDLSNTPSVEVIAAVATLVKPAAKEEIVYQPSMKQATCRERVGHQRSRHQSRTESAKETTNS